jgi:hypothetical protein
MIRNFLFSLAVLMTVTSAVTPAAQAYTTAQAAFVDRTNWATLPAAGPYAGLGTVLVNTLSDLTISATTSVPYSDVTHPLKYKTVTINASKTWQVDGNTIIAGNFALYLWCDTLIFKTSATIEASGGSGAPPPDDFQGGDGGQGADYGDGGGVQEGGTPGNNGIFAWVDPSATYSFPLGGNGGARAGFAGHGGGGTGSNGNGSDAGGAGGGGAGIQSVGCNNILGAANAHAKANGGDPSLDSNSDLLGQTGGGGGVIYYFSRFFNGQLTNVNVTVSGSSLGGANGSKQIFKINPNLSLSSKSFGTTF